MEFGLLNFIWSGRRRECLGGCWYTSGGLNFNVTTVHFWIEFYLQFSNGQNEFIDHLYDLDDLFASRSMLAYQGPCLWSSFVKHLKIKNSFNNKSKCMANFGRTYGINFLFGPIFAGKTLIFRKHIVVKWFFSCFEFSYQKNKIRRDYSTSLLGTFPRFLDGFCKISVQWLSKFTPQKCW